MGRLADVATSTVAAAHRRDHEHRPDVDTCHPHVVEVVHLGSQAVCVCHDCRLDTGFLPRREAELTAADHRQVTRDASVALRSA